MNHQRPVNLDLTTLKFPVTAIVSILHRLSGIALFLLMPVMLYVLHLSLLSEASFNALQETLTMPIWKIVLWIFATSLLYHLFAGIRHILMDLGIGESLLSAQKTSVVVLAFSVVAAIVMGGWIWL